tara:strand:- start:192 stop:455 length:264 start_codon:yes stop_codon:yes gene_type:complete
MEEEQTNKIFRTSISNQIHQVVTECDGDERIIGGQSEDGIQVQEYGDERNACKMKEKRTNKDSISSRTPEIEKDVELRRDIPNSENA